MSGHRRPTACFLRRVFRTSPASRSSTSAAGLGSWALSQVVGPDSRVLAKRSIELRHSFDLNWLDQLGGTSRGLYTLRDGGTYEISTQWRHAPQGAAVALARPRWCTSQADRVKATCRNGNEHSHCPIRCRLGSSIPIRSPRRTNVSSRQAASAFSHSLQDFRTSRQTQSFRWGAWCNSPVQMSASADRMPQCCQAGSPDTATGCVPYPVHLTMPDHLIHPEVGT